MTSKIILHGPLITWANYSYKEKHLEYKMLIVQSVPVHYQKCRGAKRQFTLLVHEVTSMWT